MKLKEIIQRIKSFRSLTFPIVRRVFPSLCANDLVSIQPMSLPVGSIFYLDYTYGSETSLHNICDKIKKIYKVSKINLRYDPFAIDEDIWIPVRTQHLNI